MGGDLQVPGRGGCWPDGRDIEEKENMGEGQVWGSLAESGLGGGAWEASRVMVRGSSNAGNGGTCQGSPVPLCRACLELTFPAWRAETARVGGLLVPGAPGRGSAATRPSAGPRLWPGRGLCASTPAVCFPHKRPHRVHPTPRSDGPCIKHVRKCTELPCTSTLPDRVRSSVSGQGLRA